MALGDEVRGEGVVLRPYREQDADDVAAACSDPLTQRFLPQLPSPYTHADAMEWITVQVPDLFARGSAGYAIADPDTDRVIGGLGLIRGRFGGAETGYWVAPWARARGVASEATTLVARHAFGHGIERLTLRTAWENVASQRVAIAAGFTREGVERGSGRGRNGQRHDRIVWARLASDPEGPSRRLLPDLPGRSAHSPGELTDGVVRLRPLTERDTEDMYALRSLPDVQATSVPPDAPRLDDIARMCARAPALWLAGARADFTIRDAQTGAFTGEIGLYYNEPGTQQAMIGYSQLPAWRGRGYVTRASRLVAVWAFEHAGIRRLIAGTVPDNVRSQRVLERAGFVREGYQRARLPGANGTRLDDILFALLPDSPLPGYDAAREITP